MKKRLSVADLVDEAVGPGTADKFIAANKDKPGGGGVIAGILSYSRNRVDMEARSRKRWRIGLTIAGVLTLIVFLGVWFYA